MPFFSGWAQTLDLEKERSSTGSLMSPVLRVLYISAVVPDTTSGGRFAMYRHFIERSDFEVKVASANRATGATVGSFEVRVMYAVERLRRTRFARLAHNLG